MQNRTSENQLSVCLKLTKQLSNSMKHGPAWETNRHLVTIHNDAYGTGRRITVLWRARRRSLFSDI
jgi:hypothetical protein